MRKKALLPPFLLVLAAVILGATLFPEQIVHATTTPFQDVVVQNTSTNPIPVQQVGTSTTSVTGTVGIDPGQNTVNLGSTDSGRLANIESALGDFKFDGSGNLETTAQTTALDAVTEQCMDNPQVDYNKSTWDLAASDSFVTLCNGQDFYLSNLTAGALDDNVEIEFLDGSKVVLDLFGSGSNGSTDYQMDLTHPIHVTDVQARCFNNSSDCNFTLEPLGYSTGS